MLPGPSRRRLRRNVSPRQGLYRCRCAKRELRRLKREREEQDRPRLHATCWDLLGVGLKHVKHNFEESLRMYSTRVFSAHLLNLD